MNKQGGMGRYFFIMMLVMALGLSIAFLWNQYPIIKSTAHVILDPTVGRILDFNINLGMLIVTALITMIITLVQKYTTNQQMLRELKVEQKALQAEMKKYEKEPEKLLELNKKQLEIFPKTMELTMRPLLFTSLPIILFFRWFNDYFILNPVKIFGILSWFWAYLIFSIIFSIIFRKIFKVA